MIPDLDSLRASAKNRDPQAAYALSVALAVGSGGDHDWKEAMRWLSVAAQRLETAAEQMRLLEAWLDPETWPPMPEPVPLCRAPVILALPGFLPVPMCHWLKLQGQRHIRPARVFDEATGEGRADDGRTNSAGAFGSGSEDLVLALARRRIASISGVPTIAFEPAQILAYQVAQIFDWHVDYLDPATPAFAADIALRGQRIATCLLFLNEDFDGGETAFAAEGIRHRGRTGDGLLWSNVLPDGHVDPDTAHAGLPTTSGAKWVLSQWIRDKAQPVSPS